MFEDFLREMKRFAAKDLAIWSNTLRSLVTTNGAFNACYAWSSSDVIAKIFLDFIWDGLCLLWKNDYMPFFGFGRDDRPTTTPRRNLPPFFRLLELLREALEEEPTETTRWQFLFSHLQQIAILGKGVQWAMVDRQILCYSLRLFVAHVDDPNMLDRFRIHRDLQRRLRKASKLPFQPLASVILHLLKHMHLNGNTIQTGHHRLDHLCRLPNGVVRLLPNVAEREMLTLVDDGNLVWFDRIAWMLKTESLMEDEVVISAIVNVLIDNDFDRTTWGPLYESMKWHIQHERSPGHIRAAVPVIMRFHPPHNKAVLQSVMHALRQTDASQHLGAFSLFIDDLMSADPPSHVEKDLGRVAKDWAPRLLTTMNPQLNARVRDAVLRLIACGAISGNALHALFQACIEHFSGNLKDSSTRKEFEELLKVVKPIAEIADDEENGMKSQAVAIEAAMADLPYAMAASGDDDDDLEGKSSKPNPLWSRISVDPQAVNEKKGAPSFSKHVNVVDLTEDMDDDSEATMDDNEMKDYHDCNSSSVMDEDDVDEDMEGDDSVLLSYDEDENEEGEVSQEDLWLISRS